MRSSRLLWLSAAAVLLLVAAIAAVMVWRWYEHALPVPGERVEVRIAPGASARAIARQLRAAGVLVNEDLFVAAARAADATQSLRAGRYEITRGMTVHQLIEKLRRGDVLREKLTIVEGWTYREMRAALAATPELRPDSAKLSDAELLKAIGATETHPEGLFAPDTYLFDPGSSDLDLLRSAYRAQTSALAQAWEQRAATWPLKSPYELLILASIIEKETGQAAERDLVAGVFVNRLRIGMRLQTDPTVIYGLGSKFDGNLRKRDLLADGPYNSYTRAGLPPTPIALPGRASLRAAVNPAATRALYFVARGDGTSQFSDTLADHNRAVARYQLAPASR
ncbi:MAG: endolytic transglycosylase MltG [Burkholderiaceae bacterium]|nr:endolytic transglycosylase MltG [Burkholderiaceae bacterium]